MELIDAHAHLQNERFAEDFEDFICRQQQLLAVVCAGTNLKTSKQAVEIASKFDFVYATVGVHPEDLQDFDVQLQQIEQLIQNKKVVAIGEIGLDYFYLKDLEGAALEKAKALQKAEFEKQIVLANKYNLPIVVHSRDAMGDTLEILKRTSPKMPSLLHCYSGSIESAKILMDMDFSFSFGGVVTFKNAKNVQEVVKNLPLQRILLETDCPYMAPEPNRGTRNEPKNVVYVADKIAKLKEISIEEVAAVTTQNAKKLFKI